MTDKKPSELSVLVPAANVLLGTRGVSKSTERRAEITLSCRDTDYIPKVKDAGEIVKINETNVQIMHNGIMVKAEGYQGSWQARVIKGLKGTHEPQEEKVFYEVLKRIKPGATMLELGSWWSYYSLWFLKSIKNSKAYCTEPDPENIKLGRFNMRLNGYSEPENMVFYQAASGSKNGTTVDFVTEKKESIRVPVRTVDSIVEEQGIKKLDILHMDIQGAELEALKGSVESIKSGKIRFLFVSTHHYAISGDPEMHDKCINFIKKHGGHIISKHTVAESCSGDGLVVASFSPEDKEFNVSISLQPTDESLFRGPDEDLAILWSGHDRLLKYIQDREKQWRVYQEEVVRPFEEKLHWIHSNPIRFTLGNLYHVYVKRDRQKGEMK